MMVLYLTTVVLAVIFVGTIVAARQLTPRLLPPLVILLCLSLALVLTTGTRVTDLTIKKGILYLTIIAGFIGAAFLRFDIGPFSIFPFRVLLPLLWLLFLLGMLINEGKLNIMHIKVKHYLLFLGLWLIYAILSLAWAADKIEALREIIFLFMGVSVIFFVVYYCNNFSDLKRLYTLWLLVLVPLVCIGLWEHTTGNHLSISGLADVPERFRYAPTGVFQNQNDYATYLALSISFVITFVRYNDRLLKRLFGMVLLMPCLYLVVVTFSRANYLAIILGLAFWFLFLLKIRSKVKVLALAGIVAVLLFVVFSEQVLRTLGVVGAQLSGLAAPSEHTLGSVGVRLNLIKNSLIFLMNSYGFGVGAGNVEYYMTNFSVYETGGILNVHNWWAEILVDYGILIFIGYTLFYLGLLVKLYIAYGKLTDNSRKMICEALLVGLVVFFFASISSSSIMAIGAQWILFSLALSFLNCCRLKQWGSKR